MSLASGTVLSSIFSMGIVASVVGCWIYMGLRAFENCNPVQASWLYALGMSAGFIIIGVVTPRVFPHILVATLLMGIGGAQFHQKSEGNSANWLLAFSLMAFATLISLVIDAALLTWRHIAPPTFPNMPVLLIRNYGYVIAVFLATPVFLTPFLMWAYENFQLRPGQDKPLNFEDDAQ